MTRLRRKNEATRLAIGKTQWLAALERELKSRVGWVDEAVSPFAGRGPRQGRAKLHRAVLRAEKAA
jgi:hypothetical protein